MRPYIRACQTYLPPPDLPKHRCRIDAEGFPNTVADMGGVGETGVQRGASHIVAGME